MELIFVLGALIAYVSMIGFFKPSMAALSDRRCTKEGHRYRDSVNAQCECNHSSDGFWLAFFWPITIPFNLFSWMGLILARDPGLTQAKQRREIEAANHRLALAQKENEITAELEKASQQLDSQLNESRKEIENKRRKVFR